ncbi:MAG: NAD(P)-dependent alcohol dehydrogenase [Pseudomonadota bacterium]
MTEATAVVLDGFGIEKMRPDPRPIPEPGPGQVLVQVAAVSLNYRDYLLVNGIYNPRQPMPVIPCSDGAGIVVSVGAGVTAFKPGDRVVSVFMSAWPAGSPTSAMLGETRGGPGGDGFLTTHTVCDAHALLSIPETLSLNEAATLPCAAITAWNAVIAETDLPPGGTVLVQGTGGVAIFAAQFAKAAGAKVAILSSSDEKLAAIADLNPDYSLNYRDTPDWGKAVRRDFTPDGVDLVIEVGGEATLEQSLRAVRTGGTIALIGVLSGAIAPINLPLVVMRHVRLQGITCGSRQDMQAMLSAIAHHEIKPRISHVFPFEAFRAAFETMGAGGHLGKIVIEVAPADQPLPMHAGGDG